MAVGGLIAGGINWAVQQRMIPNPLPGISPNPPAPRKAAPVPASTARSYRNCTEVWSTIGRSIKRSDAGYGHHLDRDDDGVGCESRPR